MKYRIVKLSEIATHPRMSLLAKDYLQPKLTYPSEVRPVRCDKCKREFAIPYYLDEYNKHYGLTYVCKTCREVKDAAKSKS